MQRPQRQKPRNGAKRMVMQAEFRGRAERDPQAYHRASANRNWDVEDWEDEFDGVD